MSIPHLVSGSVSSSHVIMIKDNLTISSKFLSYHFVSSWIATSSSSYESLLLFILVLFSILVRLTHFNFENHVKSSPKSVTAVLLELSARQFDQQFVCNTEASKLKVLAQSGSLNSWKSKAKGGECEISAVHQQIASHATSRDRSVLFIDSIVVLSLLGHASSSLATLISDLSHHFASIVFVVHTDLCTNLSLMVHLESIATCIIDMIEIPTSAPLVDITGSYQIVQKRKSGKISRAIEHYKVPKSSKELVFYTNAHVMPKKSVEPALEAKLKSKMDQLTPEQEAARASVALPFVKARQTASQSVSGLPEYSLDTSTHDGAVYVDPEDIDPDADTDLDDF